MKRFHYFLLITLASAVTSLTAQSYIEAKSWWTQKEYTRYPTTTLADTSLELPLEPAQLGRFGGNKALQHEATGFFRVQFDGKKWVMVDPEGYEFFQVGCNSVRMNPTANGRDALRKKYGTPERWAVAVVEELRELGFNMLANWSDVPRGDNIPRFPYVIELGLIQEFGKSLGVAAMGYGHHKYEGDVIPVFHPDFPKFARNYIEKNYSHVVDDPWLVGYFSDNELPLTEDVLPKYLALPEGNVNREAALLWLSKRNIPVKGEFTEAVRLKFLEHVVSTYCRIVSESLRKVDPNHLLLGCRFLGRDSHLPSLWRGASEHVDVISLNLYGVWTPSMEQMDEWVRYSGKPFFITEWYSKAMDTGMPNTGGAGWLVKTQADRAKHYEHFTLSLLKHPGCVGWHWFKYMDNDPSEAGADASNKDANKGYVNNRYEPYEVLTDSMRAINTQVYWLRDKLLKQSF